MVFAIVNSVLGVFTAFVIVKAINYNLQAVEID